jgi:hypothetical protein
MSNASDIEVSFGGTERKRLTFNTGKGFFNEKNRAFNKDTVTVEIIPMLSAARDTGVKTKVFVRVGIRAFVRIVSAGIVAETDGIRRTFDFEGFMADIFESEGTIFTFTNTMKDKWSFINGTKGSTVIIKIRMSRAGITGIKRDTHSLEVKIITEHGIGIIFIKRRITEESMVSAQKMRVSGEKIQENRFEGSRIGDFFINIRIVSFPKNGFRVTTYEIFIKKRYMTNNTESVSDKPEFMSITEMTVDILLIDKRISLGNCGHLRVSESMSIYFGVFSGNFLGVIDFGVDEFRIIFFDVRLAS